jgi:Flp pilus assembly protein TadG
MSSVSSTTHRRNRTRLSGFLSRFRRDRDGSVAIEFTMLAIPFSLLVFAILESCIAFAGQEVMANATDDVARQLRTGQIKSVNETELKQLICDRLDIIVAQGCPGLSVDLRNFTTFDKAAKLGFRINGSSIILTDGDSDDIFTVDPGEAGSKNMLRVFYKWPVVTDFMSKYLSNLDDGTTLHFASITWQNEPY